MVVFSFFEGINATFWYTRNVLITTLTGDQYNKYMGWIKTYNLTYPWYNLWSIYNGDPSTDGKLLIQDNECFQFAWNSFAYFHSLGATLLLPSAKMTFLALLTGSTPVKVSMSDPTVNAAVLAFYEKLISQVGQLGPLSFIDIIIDMIQHGVFYVRVDTDYYQISPNGFGVYYQEEPTD